MCWGGGGHRNCNASQSNVQKNSRGEVRGSGAEKLEKNNAGKSTKSTPKKKFGHRFPCTLYFFIHPQPNNIGPVR